MLYQYNKIFLVYQKFKSSELMMTIVKISGHIGSKLIEEYKDWFEKNVDAFYNYLFWREEGMREDFYLGFGVDITYYQKPPTIYKYIPTWLLTVLVI